MATRPTIADIARELQISKAAVSYALNGQPGVGEQTRQRVLDVARNLGWQPSASARALGGFHTKVIGLALARPAQTVAIESFFIRFLVGVETALAKRDWSLLLRIIGDHPDQEVEVYRKWWGEGRIDGVILVDERHRDPRITAVDELGLPAVLCGGPRRDTTMPCLWTDQAADAETLTDYLAGLGHRRIAHIAGPREFAHERGRQRGMQRAAARHGLDLLSRSAAYDAAAAVQATRSLMADPTTAPTAIVYANDLNAVAGQRELENAGFTVPQDVSVISWDDSPLTEMVATPITALARETEAYGEQAATVLLDRIAGVDRGRVRVTPSDIVIRDSTGPARAAR
ncbi:LacI family DNA-binding transcriptional regulator [Branchiibius sp. NY16-3462-2]|uniref:LacI family DNA-binding transcriptional regulator n=1 Tax=Branchiibius sp. NY16-3462-2 TaxID=1807500 RepID=UPI000794312C|nr:LacI family DNA-binding transcriptional regulator [Branchiibius sp. NY16-3462-2]KYH43288.1 hypothetical protein AZH51_13130 [Branchiibius sp. NY16-3462-2]